MKKHNYFVKLATLALALVLTLSLTACGGSSNTTDGNDTQPVIQIAVPNDTTNEARALLLLQENGLPRRTYVLLAMTGFLLSCAISPTDGWQKPSLSRTVPLCRNHTKTVGEVCGIFLQMAGM